MFETLLKDLKHSLRMLRRSPGFAITAVAALALGIGANTAVFSIVDAVLLKPLPFPEPDRLVLLVNTVPQGSFSAGSPAKFAHWRKQSEAIEEVSAFRTGLVNITGTDTPEQIKSAQVSADYFKCFGAPIILGRGFSTAEDLPKGPLTALISEGLWTRRFSRDPNILGKPVLLSGEPYVVIGVVSSRFDVREFGPQPEVWTAFQLDPETSDQGHYFQVAARLKPGVTLDQAKAKLQLSAAAFRQRFPEADANEGFSVEPFGDVVVKDARPTLRVLLGAVGFVLLIACANVANLLLVRAAGRRREIAVRAAIGAGRGRIVRQLLTESVLLSLAGGFCGSILGVIGIRALMTINTADLPRLGEDGNLMGLDWRVLGFTLVISLVTGVVFGLVPALHGSRADLATGLKQSSGRSGSGFRQNKTRSLLVVSEVALALVLLTGAALLIRTSIALTSVDPGFDAANVLTMRMSLTGPQYRSAMAVQEMIRNAAEKIRAIPGVVAASASCCVPLQNGYGLPFVIVGRPLQGPSHGAATWTTVSPGFFEVFKIEVKRGRLFEERDDAHGPPVAVINEAMAKKFWKDSDPLHDRLAIGRGVMKEFATEPDRRIVGIVSDVRDGGLQQDPEPHMYIPQGQVPDAANALNVSISPMAWVIRTQVPVNSVSRQIQETIRQTSGLPVSDVDTMDEVVSGSISRQRFNMWMMMVFGTAALVLAAIGIYGLMAYSVEQRTQEIGIRLALGANGAQVRKIVVLQGLALTFSGIAIGIAASLGLTQFLASFLYGVKARDPFVFISVPLILGAVSFIAVWIPARRVSRVNPIDALRCE